LIDFHAEIGVDRVRGFGERVWNSPDASISILGRADRSDVAPKVLPGAREYRAAKLAVARYERRGEPEMRGFCPGWSRGTEREVRSEAS
jgi:hypothetical protein